MDSVICDGCNVREPFEHRCHGYRSVVRGESTDKICECKDCREADLLFPTAPTVEAKDNPLAKKDNQKRPH